MRDQPVEKGEVWLTSLPHSGGHEQEGSRPALVVADVSRMNMAIIIPITSSPDSIRFPNTLMILPSKESGIDKESRLLVFQIRSIDKARLAKKLGKADSATVSATNAILKDLLKIS